LRRRTTDIWKTPPAANIQPDTFTEVAAFESFFEDKTIDLNDADYWFEIDPPNFSSNTDIIKEICRRSPLDARLREISNKHPTEYSMVDGLFFHRNRIL
ncbi:uncharacterized protein VP01_10357g2, partial [Puccinia sorghi]